MLPEEGEVIGIHVINETALLDVLISWRGSLSVDNVLLVDCRMMSDPGKRDRWHIGLEAAKMAAFVAHREFKRWLAKLAADVQRLRVRTMEGRLVIICYCRKGVHRIVSASAILRHALTNSPGSPFDIEPTEHLSRHLWQSGYCGECHSCRAASYVRTHALTQVARHWTVFFNRF